MHGELEAALQSMKSQLEATESELDKQRALNEKLETDLLQMDQRKGDVGGGASPANGTSTPVDVLAGLELGKKPGVSLAPHKALSLELILCQTPGITSEEYTYTIRTIS